MHSQSLHGTDALVARLRRLLLLPLLSALLFMAAPEALAHGVAEGDKGFIQESSGVMLLPFIYLGAKHMITGYDHLLFLFGVIFFLYRLKDVGLYVTLFAAAQPAPAAAPAPVAPAAQPAPQPQPAPVAMQQHEVNLTLKPNQATEIKLEMKKGAEARFHWTANGGQLNYDTHGDPYKAPRGFYHGYGKGKQTPEQQGVLVAAFDGKHGWFWRNRTNQTVKLTLRTEGDYITIEQVL